MKSIEYIDKQLVEERIKASSLIRLMNSKKKIRQIGKLFSNEDKIKFTEWSLKLGRVKT